MQRRQLSPKDKTHLARMRRLIEAEDYVPLSEEEVQVRRERRRDADSHNRLEGLYPSPCDAAYADMLEDLCVPDELRLRLSEIYVETVIKGTAPINSHNVYYGKYRSFYSFKSITYKVLVSRSLP